VTVITICSASVQVTHSCCQNYRCGEKEAKRYAEAEGQQQETEDVKQEVWLKADEQVCAFQMTTETSLMLSYKKNHYYYYYYFLVYPR